MERKTFRCDVGKENYSQLNNKVNPSNTCSTTSMIQALDYMGYQLPGDEYLEQFKQPEDKLTMFCLTDNRVAEYYSKLNKPMFDKWQADIRKQAKGKDEISLEELMTFRFNDSYPPNEVHAVLSYATNLFMGCECTTFHEALSIEEITKELVDGKPVVVSVKFGNLNHIITITGVTLEEMENNVWAPVSFFVDDTYGRFDMVSKKYDKTKSGNDCEFAANDLFACMKGVNPRTEKKLAHTFNYPVHVI